jgi:hypothetical protein
MAGSDFGEGSAGGDQAVGRLPLKAVETRFETAWFQRLKPKYR